MYRLTLYYLLVLVSAAVILSYLHILHSNPLDIVFNASLAIVVCYIANKIFAWIFNAVTNIESAFITALILVLIIPEKFPVNASFIVLACGVAMATKYFLTIDKRHVFNPAAASIAAIGLLSSDHSATWWVGTPSMLPFVLVGGSLVVRKVQREGMVFAFIVSYLLLVAIGSSLHEASVVSVLQAWQVGFLDSAVCFFAFVMLTEPLTSPGRKLQRQLYAVFVAFLYTTPQLRLLPFVFTPEVALCAGNAFSYIINPNYRFVLTLKEKIQVGKGTFAFLFQPVQSFAFLPGQFLEWTLPHKNADSRGNRRYFSIASSPREQALMMTVKFNQPSSSFKSALSQMKQGDSIIASQVAGDFVLPSNSKKPLVFIAGGIGIAPFRSMIQAMIDAQEKRDIIVLYANSHIEDIAFADLLLHAAAVGVKTRYILTDKTALPVNWQGEVGYISREMIERLVPDYMKRTFYISGPQLMVEKMQQQLSSLHIPTTQIIIDYFPGY